MSQPHWVCPHSRRVCFPCLHCLGSRLLCRELSKAGPGLHAPPRSKLLRFRHLGSPQRRRLGWACVLCPSQVRATQVTRCLASAATVTYCLPHPCRSVFWVYNWHTFSGRCWLNPSESVQNPKFSWLATKPACSLVDNASLWLRLPPSGSGCPRLPVSRGGWLVCSRLALLSPLFCEWAWWCLRLGLFAW